jgi:predicted O-linked N-acetylglucosamine transferase (SPINDLY family)
LRLTRIRSPQRAAEIVALLESSAVAAGRIECVAERSDPPHGRQFQGIDIALDHYPYNGVTTTCEALHAGVPVVSLHGRNSVSRSGLSLLGSLGLGELSAATADEYVGIALALAGDLERLERLRASLPARLAQSPLRDETGCAARFEELLHAAWQQYRTHRPIP